MLAVLLESRAARQRRTGGAILSVAAHIAIVGGAIAFAVTKTDAHPAADRPIIVPVRFPDPAPKPATSDAPRHATVAGPTIDLDTRPVIDIPSVPPVGIPPIQPSSGISPDVVRLGGPHKDGSSLGGNLLGDSGNDAGSTEWRGNELLMRIAKSATPDYPEQLRRAGVNGRVLVRFIVDTSGRVDPTSINVVQSTHELFSDAARRALTRFRFLPAEVSGRRVRAAAEMPFEFVLK